VAFAADRPRPGHERSAKGLRHAHLLHAIFAASSTYRNRRMIKSIASRSICAGVFLLAGHAAYAQTYTYTQILPPGSVATTPIALDSAGTVLGIWYDTSDSPHGFTYLNGTYTEIDFPKAIYTQPSGFNDKGEIVGSYVLSDHLVRAFTYKGGHFKTVVAPGAPTTEIAGINSKATILGYSSAGSGSVFTLKNGTFTTINDQSYAEPVAISNTGSAIGGYYPPQPQPITSWIYVAGTLTTLPINSSDVEATGLNDKNEVVGIEAGISSYEGFLYKNTKVKTITVPKSTGTYPESISDQGDITGYYTDAKYTEFGFVLSKGSYTKLAAPKAAGTYGLAMNKAGQVLGGYHDADRNQYVFLATPSK
jgi:hypothetical protein